MVFGIAQKSLQADVTIIEAKGKIMVRFGIEESWQKAQIGSTLKDIDSILSGEDGRVTLQLVDGSRFDLGSNAVLDIADIREIQQRELFMYLMSQKIDKLETPNDNPQMQVGNVSIIHGAAKQVKKTAENDTAREDWYPYEINGALALYNHNYFPNTIIKFIKIQNKYNSDRDNGKIDYYIGKSFEALNDMAQARDAYQRALDKYKKSNDSPSQEHAWVSEARLSLERLNQE
jgi:TolA-binding protein